ncbi:histone methylation protein dot1 [Cystoisospora suis]|uniref:Histone methylation protein dot1 n=1 Tax=Cystoisospora suis TaxID=483139 RepID=A0A2C6LI69_9APIC|nr:histone methylation protein dot1 [Cystoisospora suis]
MKNRKRRRALYTMEMKKVDDVIKWSGGSLPENKGEDDEEDEEKEREERRHLFLSSSRLATPRKTRKDERGGRFLSSSCSQERERGGKEENDEEFFWSSATPSTCASITSDGWRDVSSVSSSSSSPSFSSSSPPSSSLSASLSPSSSSLTRTVDSLSASSHSGIPQRPLSSPGSLSTASPSSVFFSPVSASSSSLSTAGPVSSPSDGNQQSSSLASSPPAPSSSCSSSSLPPSSSSSSHGLIADVPLFSHVRRLQRRTLMKLTGSDEGAYGENCCASLLVLFRLLQERYFLSSSSIFLDIGSGSGIPSFLASATVGCISTLGVELDSNVYSISCNNHLQLVDHRLLSSLENLHRFQLFSKERELQQISSRKHFSSSLLSPASSLSSYSPILQTPTPSDHTYCSSSASFSSSPSCSILSSSTSSSNRGQTSAGIVVSTTSFRATSSPMTESSSAGGGLIHSFGRDEEGKESFSSSSSSLHLSVRRESELESLSELTEDDILFTCANVNGAFETAPMAAINGVTPGVERESVREKQRGPSRYKETKALRKRKRKESEGREEDDDLHEEEAVRKGRSSCTSRSLYLQSARYINSWCSFLPLSFSPPSSNYSFSCSSSPSSSSIFSASFSQLAPSPPPSGGDVSSSCDSSFSSSPSHPSSSSQPPFPSSLCLCDCIFSLPGGLAYPCNTAFRCIDASLLSSFGGITHIFSFDLAMPPWILFRLCRLFNLSRSPMVYVSFHSDLISKHHLHADLAQRLRMRMSGSGESHVAFIYVRKNLPSSLSPSTPHLSLSSSSCMSKSSSFSRVHDSEVVLSLRQQMLISSKEESDFMRRCSLQTSSWSPSYPSCEGIVGERRNTGEHADDCFSSSSLSFSSSSLSRQLQSSFHLPSSSSSSFRVKASRVVELSQEEERRDFLLEESEARAILLRGMSESYTQRFFNKVILEGSLPFISRLLLFATFYLLRFLSSSSSFSSSSSSSSSSAFGSRNGVGLSQEQEEEFARRLNEEEVTSKDLLNLSSDLSCVSKRVFSKSIHAAHEEEEEEGEEGTRGCVRVDRKMPLLSFPSRIERRDRYSSKTASSYVLKWWLDLSFSFSYLPQQQIFLLRRIFTVFGLDRVLELGGDRAIEELRALLLLSSFSSSSSMGTGNATPQTAVSSCGLCREEKRERQDAPGEVYVHSNERVILLPSSHQAPSNIPFGKVYPSILENGEHVREDKERMIWRDCFLLLINSLENFSSKTPSETLCIHRIEQLARWLKDRFISPCATGGKKERRRLGISLMSSNEKEKSCFDRRSCKMKKNNSVASPLPSLSGGVERTRNYDHAKNEEMSSFVRKERTVLSSPEVIKDSAWTSSRPADPRGGEADGVGYDEDEVYSLDVWVCPRLGKQIDHMKEKQRYNTGSTLDRLTYGKTSRGDQSCRRSARPRKDLFFPSSSSSSEVKRTMSSSRGTRGREGKEKSTTMRRSSQRDTKDSQESFKTEGERVDGETMNDEEEEWKKFLFHRHDEKTDAKWIHVATWCPSEGRCSGVCTPAGDRKRSRGYPIAGEKVRKANQRKVVLRVPCFSPLCYICGERDMVSQLLSSTRPPPIKQYLLQKEIQELQKTPLIQLTDKEGYEAWNRKLRMKFDQVQSLCRAGPAGHGCHESFSSLHSLLPHQNLRPREEDQEEGDRAVSSLFHSSSTSISDVDTDSSEDIETDADSHRRRTGLEEEEGRKRTRGEEEEMMFSRERKMLMRTSRSLPRRGRRIETGDRNGPCYHVQREKTLGFLEAFFRLRCYDAQAEREDEEDELERRSRDTQPFSMPACTVACLPRDSCPLPSIKLTRPWEESEVKERSHEEMENRGVLSKENPIFACKSHPSLLWKEEHEGEVVSRPSEEEDRDEEDRTERKQSSFPSLQKPRRYGRTWRATILSIKRRKSKAKESVQVEGRGGKKEKIDLESKGGEGEEFSCHLEDQQPVISLEDFSYEWVTRSFKTKIIVPPDYDSSYSSSSITIEDDDGMREAKRWALGELKRQEMNVLLLLSLLNEPLLNLLVCSSAEDDKEVKMERCKKRLSREGEAKEEEWKATALQTEGKNSWKENERRREEEASFSQDDDEETKIFEGRKRRKRRMILDDETDEDGDIEVYKKETKEGENKRYVKEEEEKRKKDVGSEKDLERSKQEKLNGQLTERESNPLWSWVDILEPLLAQELILIDQSHPRDYSLFSPSSFLSALPSYFDDKNLRHTGERRTVEIEKKKERRKKDRNGYVNDSSEIERGRDHLRTHEEKKSSRTMKGGGALSSMRDLILSQILRLKQLKVLKRMREEEKKSRKNGAEEDRKGRDQLFFSSSSLEDSSHGAIGDPCLSNQSSSSSLPSFCLPLSSFSPFLLRLPSLLPAGEEDGRRSSVREEEKEREENEEEEERKDMPNRKRLRHQGGGSEEERRRMKEFRFFSPDSMDGRTTRENKEKTEGHEKEHSDEEEVLERGKEFKSSSLPLFQHDVGMLARQFRRKQEHFSLSTCAQIASSLLVLLYPEETIGEIFQQDEEEEEEEDRSMRASFISLYERVEASCELLHAVESILVLRSQDLFHPRKRTRASEDDEKEKILKTESQGVRKREEKGVESETAVEEDMDKRKDEVSKEFREKMDIRRNGEESDSEGKKDILVSSYASRHSIFEERRSEGMEIDREPEKEENKEIHQEKKEKDDEVSEKLQLLRQTLLKRLLRIKAVLEKEREEAHKAIYTWIVSREFQGHPFFSSSSLSPSSSSPDPNHSNHKNEEKEEEERTCSFLFTDHLRPCCCLYGASSLHAIQESFLRSPLPFLCPLFDDSSIVSYASMPKEKSSKSRWIESLFSRGVKRRRKSCVNEGCPWWYTYYYTIGCVCMHKEFLFKRKLKEFSSLSINKAPASVDLERDKEEDKKKNMTTMATSEKEEKVVERKENTCPGSETRSSHALSLRRKENEGKEKDEEKGKAQVKTTERSGQEEGEEELEEEEEEKEGRKIRQGSEEEERVKEKDFNTRRLTEMMMSLMKEEEESQKEQENKEDTLSWSVCTPSSLIECCASSSPQEEKERMAAEEQKEKEAKQVFNQKTNGDSPMKKSSPCTAVGFFSTEQENIRPYEQLNEKGRKGDKIRNEDISFLHSPKAPRKRRSSEGKVYEEATIEIF